MTTNPDIRQLGAVGDGIHLDSPAIQAAINQVAAAGGGMVVIPPGRWRCGSLQLTSRLTLQLQNGATLIASHNLDDYQPDHQAIHEQGRGPYHLLIADDCCDIRIEGGGRIDGEGPHFWHQETTHGGWVRPLSERPSPLIELRDCARVHLSGLAIVNSPGWAVHCLRCSEVWLVDLQINNQRQAPNGDGLILNGCHNVFVRGCHIHSGSDGISLKTSRDAAPCHTIHITECICSSYCAGISLGPESWHDFDQIAISNCIIHHAHRGVAIYGFDGGRLTHLTISRLTYNGESPYILNHPLHLDLRQRTDQSRRSRLLFLQVNGLCAHSDGRLLLTCADDCEAHQVSLSDIALHYPVLSDPQAVASQATAWQSSLHNDEARGARGAIVADGLDELHIQRVQVHWPQAGASVNWGDGQQRREHGSAQLYPPAGSDEPFAMAVVWGRGLIGGRIDLGGLRACDGGPAADIDASSGVTLVVDET